MINRLVCKFIIIAMFSLSCIYMYVYIVNSSLVRFVSCSSLKHISRCVKYFTLQFSIDKEQTHIIYA